MTEQAPQANPKRYGHLFSMDRWQARMWFGNDDFEMIVNWYNFHDRDGTLAACLEVFQDEWHAFPQIHDVLEAMAQAGGKRIQPAEFAKLLESCGYELDEREREESWPMHIA